MRTVTVSKKSNILKILAFFTACVLLTATLPSAVFAKVVHSGTCGENASWTLDGDGTLTVSASGASGKIGNYSYFENAPWYAYRSDVKKVVINSGIKVIGSEAFSECAMTSVSIPDGVVSIGARAFDGCKELKEITIPGSVSVIGDRAFQNCGSLGWLQIEPGVKEIGDFAFCGCVDLTGMIIPGTLTKIGDSAFYDTYYYNEKSMWSDGALYIGKYLISARGVPDDYKIKEGTLLIADVAFGGSGIKNLTIPDSVTGIGDAAFYNCGYLKNVNIPLSVKEIGGYAFYACAIDTVTIPDTVLSIGEKALGYKFDGSARNGFKIRCFENTEAERYAKDNGFEYEIMNVDYLTTVKPDTAVSDFINSYKTIPVSVADSRGKAVSDGLMGTGYRVKILSKDYRIVIYGDTDGNGKIDATDYLMIKRHILRLSALYGAYFKAADTDKNGVIDTTDYMILKRVILGIASLG